MRREASRFNGIFALHKALQVHLSGAIVEIEE